MELYLDEILKSLIKVRVDRYKRRVNKRDKRAFKTDENENIDINPNYLNYFDEDELKDIVFRLIEKS